jgi:hypothetical protein
MLSSEYRHGEINHGQLLRQKFQQALYDRDHLGKAIAAQLVMQLIVFNQT